MYIRRVPIYFEVVLRNIRSVRSFSILLPALLFQQLTGSEQGVEPLLNACAIVDVVLWSFP